MDDLLIITKVDCSDHLKTLEVTAQKLQYNGLKCNIEKSFFGQTKMEYLGFWLTWIGIQPINKKVESTVDITLPNNKKGVSVLIVIVN